MTPSIVVAAFHDAAAAQRAADALVSSGIPDSDIALHRSTPDAANTFALNADEMLTGGLVASFGHLLDGLMATSPPPGNAADYRDLVRREGTLVTVTLGDTSTASGVKATFESAGAERVATLPQPGLES